MLVGVKIEEEQEDGDDDAEEELDTEAMYEELEKDELVDVDDVFNDDEDALVPSDVALYNLQKNWIRVANHQAE